MLTWWWYCHGMGFYGSLISCLILSLYPVCCVMSLVGMFHCLFTCCSQCSVPVLCSWAPPQFDCSPIPVSHQSCWHCLIPSAPCVPASVPCASIGTLFCFSIFLCFLDLPLSVFVLHVYGLTLSVLIRIFFCLNLTGVTTVWMPIPNTLERRASFFVNWIIWVNIQSIS